MLHFNGIEPIDFGGKQCEVKMDAEKRLRLSATRFDTEENVRNADEVLASCFEDDYAKEFIRTKLSVDDKVVIRTYLLSGETGLNRLSRATDDAVEKYITRAIADQGESNE